MLDYEHQVKEGMYLQESVISMAVADCLTGGIYELEPLLEPLQDEAVLDQLMGLEFSECLLEQGEEGLQSFLVSKVGYRHLVPVNVHQVLHPRMWDYKKIC